MRKSKDSGPVFGSPEYTLGLLDRELGAYETFEAVTKVLVVRRTCLRRLSGALIGRAVVYEPNPMSVRDENGRNPIVVGLVLGKHETVPPHMRAEAEFWGLEYFNQPSERDVVPKLTVLNAISSSKAETVERYTRPAIEVRRNDDTGLFVSELADPSFVMGNLAMVDFEQESYVGWLNLLARQRLA